MIDLSERGSRARVWLLVAGWTVVASITALILRMQVGLFLPYAFLSALAWYYWLGALVWLVCIVHARLELWRKPALRVIAVHLLLGVAALALWSAGIVSFHRLVVGPDYWRLVFEHWPWQLVSIAMTYAASVGLGLIVQSVDRERNRQRHEAELEVATRDAELTAIKAQLQPHFLFNSLNSIVALMEHDPNEARHMLVRLSSLLHSVFDRLDEPLVPLDRELETIRDYLEIERIRFGDRLTFDIDAGPDARGVLVPPFLLQPIVENAIKHGIEPIASPGTVHIAARLSSSHLRVDVVDSGPGSNGSHTASGRGLALTRRRLDAVYGDGAATLRTGRDANGFGVMLELPVMAHV